MKISLSWLSDFVDLSNIDPHQLAEKVTEQIAEVEHVTKTGCDIDNVIVGKIQKIEAVEGADKIRLTTVDIGDVKTQDSASVLQIVCGAQNIYEGAVVPVAVVGAELPGGLKIEKRKMKGVESCGMICSEAELGLAEKSEGIMLLPEDTPIGKKFSEVCPQDTILEIDNHAITHRPDLFGHFGFAREVALLQGTGFRFQVSEMPKYDKVLDVEVSEPELCPRYIGLRISNVKVMPSPSKIKERLEACGVRAINNIVDATNYVMLELGEPMHAFDSKKLAGGWIIVRKAKADEKLITLDNEERELTEDMLVIADAEKPVALAGVMGGANSEVDDSTTEIVLEAANFEAASVRRTSTVFGLRSESSLRFEKRLDPELPPKAIARFIEILKETCPDLKIESGNDVINFKAEKRVLPLALEKLEKKLGKKIEAVEVKKILEALEFKVSEAEVGFEVEIPSFRAGRDIEQEIDLIEEVIRHIGYSDLPSSFPKVELHAPKIDKERELIKELNNTMLGFGFHETATLAMVSADLFRKSQTDIEKAVSLQNPPSEDFKYLRTNLLMSLLEAASKNIKNSKSFRLFEISNFFEKNDSEPKELTALVVGEQNSFQIVRGIAESLLTSLKLTPEFKPTSIPSHFAHPGRVAEVMVNGKSIGEVAELHPALAKNFDLPVSGFINLDFSALFQLSDQTVLAEPLPKFPGVPRDIAVVVPEKTLAIDVSKAIQLADERIQEIELFDSYTGEGILEGHKSLAFSFQIIDLEKTLEDSETEGIIKKIVENIEKIGGKLR